MDVVLTKTQEYTIRVYDRADGTGTFSLFLERTVPPSPNARQETYGQNLTDQFALAGDLDEFFFIASAGDVVDITTIGGTTYPCFTLFAPDAKTTWTACGAGSHVNELRTQALTLAGIYTIFLYDRLRALGTIGSSFNASPGLASSPRFQTSLDMPRYGGHRWRGQG